MSIVNNNNNNNNNNKIIIINVTFIIVLIRFKRGFQLVGVDVVDFGLKQLMFAFLMTLLVLSFHNQEESLQKSFLMPK